MGRLADDLLLGQLALQGIRLQYGRVSRAGHAHRLIDIGTAGERVADRAAEAGGRAAERLDLGRMVVGFIFEIDQPLFRLSVHIDRNDDRACVDLVGLLLVVKPALFLELLGG